MSDTVIYSLYIEKAETAAVGLNPLPVFASFINIDNGTDLVVGGGLPPITELSDGFYKFSLDWASDSYNGSGYLVKIDCGDVFPDPKQRYITMRLDRQDNVFNVVDDINTASATINTASAELVRFIKRLLEVENGTWEIVGTQLLIKATGQYETDTNAGEVIGRWDLQDSDGQASALNPIKRIYHSTHPIP